MTQCEDKSSHFTVTFQTRKSHNLTLLFNFYNSLTISATEWVKMNKKLLAKSKNYKPKGVHVQFLLGSY